ncbi:ABC transporter substrate-binding protein [Rhodovulum sp.]|uniref:ABC transporter substrate-binding protein n=1 Tax=Rhodovulum sp. TaxID=34009 RepID=UPI00257AC3FB|nr:ABC transporter substrate-binding protein [Rhodovulum sp.]
MSTSYPFRRSLPPRSRAAILAVIIVTAQACAGFAQQVFPGKAPPERIPVVMVGDRLVNVAWHLGVVPEAMSVRGDLWPFGRVLANTSSMILGCPNYIVTKDADIVPRTLRERGIGTVLIEQSAPFDRTKPKRDPMNLLPVLEKADVATALGTEVTVLDFTGDFDTAIRQVGAALGREAEAEKLVETRRAQLDAVSARLPLPGPRPRVLVLDGTLQAETGKAFVRAHLPGGYTDDFLLTPLGAENAAAALAAEGVAAFAPLPRLDALAEWNPDVIVMTGDADAVQRKLAEALARNPDLGHTVPALTRHALLSLPAYYDSMVIDYPQILGRWAAAFTSLNGS